MLLPLWNKWKSQLRLLCSCWGYSTFHFLPPTFKTFDNPDLTAHTEGTTNPSVNVRPIKMNFVCLVTSLKKLGPVYMKKLFHSNKYLNGASNECILILSNYPPPKVGRGIITVIHN